MTTFNKFVISAGGQRAAAGIACALLILCSAPQAQAGVNVWTHQGPSAGLGTLSAFAVDPASPTTLYVATAFGGVAKSIDAGATWAIASTGLPSAAVCTLAIDPMAPTTLYAGTDGGGVYKSIDAGGHWAPANMGLPNNPRTCVFAIDSATPATLYAGVNTDVFKSTDRGESWTAVLMTANQVSALALDPAAPTTLYAAADGSGFYKSTDAGNTWVPLNTGLGNLYRPRLGIDPAAPMTVYASSFGGFSKSTDGGSTWTALDSIPFPCVVRALFVVGDSPTTLYALLHGMRIGFERAHSLFAPRDASGVEDPSCDTAADALWKSTDGGNTWTSVFGEYASFLATDPNTPSILYIGGADAVIRSVDRGANWITLGRLTNGSVTALLVNTSETVYAISSSVFESADMGNTWSSLSAEPSGAVAAAYDPSTPTTLYAATIGQGMYKSVDGGTSWIAINNGLPSSLDIRAIAIDPITPTTLYAGGDGVYKSINAGATWVPANDGFASGTFILALAIDPITPSTIYAATDGPLPDGYRIELVYKSTDGGALWSADSAVGRIPNYLYSIAIDSVTSTTLYVGTDEDEVYKSTDGGTTWTAVGPVNTGFPSNVNQLVVDPTMSGTLYAGTDGGVSKTSDGGKTWTPLNAGLPDTYVASLAIDPVEPNRLYAGTRSGGVFSIEQVSGTPSPTPQSSATATPRPSFTDTPTLTLPPSLTVTPTTTPEWTASPTVPHTATPSASPAPCIGDCRGDGQVRINNLIVGVDIVLGVTPLAQCPTFACDGNTEVPVSCLIAAVDNALDGCPVARPAGRAARPLTPDVSA